MKIAVFSDLHSISPHERLTVRRDKRMFFAEAWPSFSRLVKMLRDEAPDLAICLGDMVDWYSDENRDFALELLGELPCPWLAVPGNHDYESFAEQADGLRKRSAAEGREQAAHGWLTRGIELHNRYVDAGDTGLILLDSAVSGVTDGTKEWLQEIECRHPRKLLFTHVPLDVPETRSHIVSVDSARKLHKYVQSGSPWVFRHAVKGRIGDVFTGHLHIPGELHVEGTRMHMLGTAIKDPREPEYTASACIVTLGRSVDVRRIAVTRP